MKIDKSTLFSSLGLSVLHFALMLVATKFRPDFLSSGTAGSIADDVEAVLVQPGLWVTDFMGCIFEKPMWWVLMALSSVLWGNVVAFAIRSVSKIFVKDAKAS